MNPLSVDAITQAALRAGAKGLVKGFCVSACSVLLFMATDYLANEWQAWFRWPIYGAFVAGVGRMILSALLTSNTSADGPPK